MRMTKDFIREYNALLVSKDYSDKLKAAAISKELEGDTQIAEKMRILSAQLEFSKDSDDTSAVEETRKELSEMIDARKKHETMRYHHYLFDDDVLDMSSGEVTNPEGVDFDMCTFIKGGLYDPSIFGGDGTIPHLNEDGKVKFNGTDGLSIGHISLPIRCVNPNDIDEIAHLLKMDKKTIQMILSGDLWLDTEAETLIAKEDLDSKVIASKFVSYGDAVYYLLEKLNMPDHPERYAFKVLPVLCAAVRLCVMDPNSLTIGISSEIVYRYRKVLFASRRVRRLVELKAPSIILVNEFRMVQESVASLMESKNGPFEKEHNSLADLLLEAKEKKARAWVKSSILTALRYRLFDMEIPLVTNSVEIKPCAALDVPARIQGSDEEISVLNVIESIHTAMDSIHDQMWEIETGMRGENLDDEESFSEEVKKLQETYGRLEAESEWYIDEIKMIHEKAAKQEPIVVVKSDNCYVLAS